MIKLVEVAHADVARYYHMAYREGAVLSDTKNTRWFKTSGGEGIYGLLYLRPDRVRIKGVFVFPEWRQHGVFHRMTEAALMACRQEGVREFEVIASRPYLLTYWTRRGFKQIGTMGNGAWRMEWIP